MEFFRASTQYGDWEGTAAADDSTPHGLREYLTENGLMTADEFLIAANLFASEGFTSIRAFVVPGENFQKVKESLSSAGNPITVREVGLDLTKEEFFDLFKRLDILLTWHGLELKGREYFVPR